MPMAYEVIVIGENLSKELFSAYDEDSVAVKDNVAIINFKNSIVSNMCYKELKNEGLYEVYTMDEYERSLQRNEIIRGELTNCTYKECIEWQFKGVENFVVSNDGICSTWEVDYDTVNRVSEMPLSGQNIVSNNGTFMANYTKYRLVLFVGHFDRIFNDFEFDKDIVRVEFNATDSHILACTSKNCYLIDIIEGIIVYKFDCTDCIFDYTGENVLSKSLQCELNILKNTNEPLKEDLAIDTVRTKYSQTMIFSDNKTKRIIYNSPKGTQSKLQANVVDVKFIFSKNRGYALITKDIRGTKKYSIESYSHDLITINNIDHEIKKIQVSDEGFVTYDNQKMVTLYKLDKYNFIKIKEMPKDDDVVMSVYGLMFAIYDGETENIEFYDGAELRSVYSHQACTNIIWAESGLYCASISRSTGLTQMYNNNGKMFWKKIFYRISGFAWRPYLKLKEHEKTLIKDYKVDDYVREFDTSNTTTSNINELISEWKKFLTDKRQLLNQKQ